MENSVRKTDVSEIPTKSKSLDIQSLYVEKSRVSKERGERRALKRKRRSLVENRELSSEKGKNLNQGKKKKKSRKEVSLSSFEPVSKKSVEGLNAVDVLKFSSLKKNDGQVTANGNLKNSNSLNNISGKLDDNVIPIPKKPRGFSRRKKYQIDRISEDAGTSRNVTSDAQVVKLTGGSVAPLISSKGKRKKHFDDFKENSSSKANSARRLKSENGASVGYVGDSSKKRVRRKRGKGLESEPPDRNSVEEFEPSVDNSAQISANLQDDDEENLEQNAARMLSSRFDPSCTGFSGNRTASTSMNDCSLTPSSGVVASPRANHSAGSESNSADAAGRVLRPRKQHKEKGHVRRRRHFYELFFRDLDAYWVLNRRIKVFWPLDQSWYFGLVNNYDPERKLHHVKYDDRDEEWINLQNERFKLLLLPSEVPRKSGSENTGVGGKHADGEGHVDAEEDNCIGSFMDSEPIISWLARSNRRIKSSPLGIRKRRKTSVLSKNFTSLMFSDDTVATPLGCLVAGPSGTYASHLSGGTVAPERPSDGNMAEKSVMDHTTRSKDRKLPLVYFRRRFRKKGQGLGCIFKESSGCRSVAGSDTSLASIVDKVGMLEELDTAFRSSGPDPDIVFWTGKNLRLLRFTVPSMDLNKVRLKLRISLQWAHNVMFGANNFRMHQLLLLLHHGMITTVWPKVRLEMLFVDNVVGLRFMLFEGCMMQAVSLVCLVLATFHQPNGYERFVDLQLPVTSIRFKFSGFPLLERHLVFVYYKFLELENSKWQYLDGKLKRYCSVTKQLPLTECTFDNIRVIQSRSNQLPVPSVSGVPVTSEGSRRRFKQGIMHMGFSKAFANINTGLSSSNSDKHRRFPPFVLSFAAAPSFFVSLHLKLLMEKNVASISFQNCHPLSLVEDPENCGRLIGDDLSLVEELGDQVKSKVEIDALSISSGGNWLRSSQNCLNGEHNVTGASVGCQYFRKNKNDGIVNPERRPCNSGSEQCAVESWPSVSDDHSSLEKSESGHFSHFNGISVQIPRDNQFGSQSLDRGRQNAQQSISNLVWHMNDCTIRSPNPTAPRSIWHRNRHNSGSSSFGYRSKLWPDGRADLIRNGLVNGSKKPRTQISYMLPFGGYDFSSKPRSHHRKGRPYKKIRNENEKMTSCGSRSPRRHPELLSCDANVLITEGDRGWRECGAEVVLEFVDHKDWRLLVKLSGVTKYSYKAYQFLQPGSTNRHTHAMMWKGGKDWILEFPDRSQWARFKEMHEECYNRNIRVASVKTIPIPGVRMIEENDDVAVEVPFVRSAAKYYRQVESDAERALNPSHVLYDMDSDDEKWLCRQRNSSETSVNYLPEITEDMFERTMDMFESVAYAQERDDFTVDEMEEIMVELGPIDVIKAIHEHWQQKRQKIRMPLIRQLQPPAWERYQQQVREWEMAMSKLHNFPNGCKENSVPIEKPAMFAFCLRPRGLEVPNKGSKQRSQRKLVPGGHNYVLSRDQDGLHILGRKSNGFEERGAVIGGHNHDYSDASPWLQTSTRILSPRDAVGSGYLSMSSDGSERNQHQNFNLNKSKKMRTVLSPTDSQMMAMSYNQRTGKRNGTSRWNTGLSEWPNQKHYQAEGFQRLRVEQLDDSDLDEFRLRDASGAAQHASNMAKLKREKAQRLLYRADLAIHKATVALMTAESIKASSEKELRDED
ncbi:Tudor domain [Macleaya cordata]|uniref:Enhancer of polycomb-like protein n=1 Tax=Macleaya cordata TaxID=56857 RepID=A0A200PNE2_MACCD|nr:Tudor domain [Macleaya cordata]